MSKQLTTSAAFSILAMAAFALLATGPDSAPASLANEGALFEASAPVLPEAPAYLPTLPTF